MKTRREIATEYYNEGKMGLDTLGLMASENFSDKIINTAYERKYITCGMAGNLLTAKESNR